jgi:hypothetical protein
MVHSRTAIRLKAAYVIKLVMAKILLSKDSEFVVREDKVMDYILALLFFALFIYGLIDAIKEHFIKLNYLSYVFIIALAPAYIFFVKGKNKRVYIRINKMGIYQDEKLLTGWQNLLNAYVDQKEKVLSIQDNFILVVEYMKDGFGQGFRRKIPLTNTQNKSEEEVIEAVRYFWMEYKKMQE